MTAFQDLPVNARIRVIELELVEHMAGFGFYADFRDGVWLAKAFDPEATLDLTTLAVDLERRLT